MGSPGFTATLALETALGKLSFVGTAVAKSDKPVRVSLGQRRPVRDLPRGMSVESWRAVVLAVSSEAALREVTYSCHLDTAQKGRACSGEGLEAWEWESAQRLLVVGTEDGERLALRYPFLQRSDGWRGTGDGRSMSVSMNSVPACQAVELHFIVAENPLPEPRDASAWFAVECPHDSLE